MVAQKHGTLWNEASVANSVSSEGMRLGKEAASMYFSYLKRAPVKMKLTREKLVNVLMEVRVDRI